jgi:cytochrome c551/c552
VGGGPIKDEEVEERKLTKKEKKGLRKLEKDIPMKSFKKQYGKDAEDIYYGTLTNLAKKKY